MLEYRPGKFSKDFATAEGKKLWEVLNRDANIARMETATDLGQPALKPLEDILLIEIGEPITDDRMKQMAGHMVRQIMESRGFVHDADGIKLASAPFYKASRYRRPVPDEIVLHLFRDSGDPNQLALTDIRDDSKLPSPKVGKRWTYYNSISSPLKASVGFGFNLKKAAKVIKKQGYFLHRRERILRPA
ncbi:hypothetical protein [Qipengyuania atrilutea]|uniref:Uncharacterized protein n=1 Tax=Qipengyuania atrilutea TaxID=2744473 RepID=A0A850H8G0_9SPHN|nr:hypothetical protein [Actirhodobacter atriluteus]NVD46128.1 hypothetical protein [Actirhodobacter atriluteus]